MRKPKDPTKYPFKTIPDDDRRPPEATAQIRELEAQKLALKRENPPGYIEKRRALNREIYRLSLIGLPRDLSWRNNDGRPAFLPADHTTRTVKLTPDQVAFCQRMSAKGNVSMGIRACIDFTMASRQLPALPEGLEDDE